MAKEPVIQDKIHLLMEETGCDQGQAELAMASTGYDLEKAIRTIGTLLKNIVVLRGKFQVPSRHLYGLIILIGDIKRHSLLRLRAVVSYNPALYETALSGDWYDFERGLYAFRLYEGTLQQVTQDLERALQNQLEREGDENIFQILREGEIDRLLGRFQRLFMTYFSDQTVEMKLSREELNLEQFRRFKSKEDDVILAGWRPEHFNDVGPGENLLLQVDLQQDADGAAAKDVRAGDSVYVLLTDNRDIAQYLSKLLGGRAGNGLTPLTAPVEEARWEGDTIHFQVRLSGGILGLAQAHSASLLRVQRRSSKIWWKRFLPFVS